MAGASRQAGDEGGEGFLLGLSALLHEYTAERAASTGETISTPADMSGAANGGSVDLGQFSKRDQVDAAKVLIEIAERYDAVGREGLGELLAVLAQTISDKLKQRLEREQTAGGQVN